MVKTTLKITGMSCGHCVMGVKSALKEIPGLTDLQVQIGEAVLTSEGPIDVEAVKNAIEEEGYQVVSVS